MTSLGAVLRDHGRLTYLHQRTSADTTFRLVSLREAMNQSFIAALTTFRYVLLRMVRVVIIKNYQGRILN